MGGWRPVGTSPNVLLLLILDDYVDSYIYNKRYRMKASDNITTKETSKLDVRSQQNQFADNLPQELSMQDKLTEQNIMLRRKLKMLSYRLDDELEKVAKERFKTPQRVAPPKIVDNTHNQLKNAHKIIDRLQKSLKQYEKNEGYNSSVTKIIDLEDVVRKKEKEIEQLKNQVKTLKRVNKQHERYIQQLIEGNKKSTNPAEDKQQIHRLKQKIKKITAENDTLTKECRAKHDKLVVLQRKVQVLQKEAEYEKQPEEDIEGENLKAYKDKYKESLEKVSKQAAEIVKLKEKISQQQQTIDSMKQIMTKKSVLDQRISQHIGTRSSRRQGGLNERKEYNELHTSMVHAPSDQLPRRIRNERGVFL